MDPSARPTNAGPPSPLDAAAADMETCLPPRLSCMRELRLVATPTRLYLIGAEPDEADAAVGVVSNETASGQVEPATSDGRGKAPSGAEPASLLSSSPSPLSPSPAHSSPSRRYRILEFDRTVREPDTLASITMERPGFFTDEQVETLVRSLLPSVPSSANAAVPLPSTPVPPPAPGTAQAPASSVFRSFASSLMGGSSSEAPQSPAVTPVPESPAQPSSSSSASSASATDPLLLLDACGLLGAVQFMRGFYLVLVTRKECIGTIGAHRVWAVRATELVPIYCEPSSSTRSTWAKIKGQLSLGGGDPVALAEGRYSSLFLSLDLTKDFYFSYTYDLTRPLQQQVVTRVGNGRGRAQTAPSPPSPSLPPCSKFVWNQFLADEFYGGRVHTARGSSASSGSAPARVPSSSCWTLVLANGFFRQVTASVFGQPLLLTLLARRSRFYAGTRYLKRGVNDAGHVANEVESEQILDDTYGRFASFVQVRGSVAAYWMQRTAIAVPKPPILLQPRDFSFEPARRHFASLFARYGAPVLLLNLVKKKERHPREKLVGREWARVAMALNRELPPELRLQYLALDYAAVFKRNANFSVLAALRDAGRWAAANVGFFSNARLGGTLLARREKVLARRRGRQGLGGHELAPPPSLPSFTSGSGGEAGRDSNSKENAGAAVEKRAHPPSVLDRGLALPVGAVDSDHHLVASPATARADPHAYHHDEYAAGFGTRRSEVVYTAPGREGAWEPLQVVGDTGGHRGPATQHHHPWGPPAPGGGSSGAAQGGRNPYASRGPALPYSAALSAVAHVPAVQLADDVEVSEALAQAPVPPPVSGAFRHSRGQDLASVRAGPHGNDGGHAPHAGGQQLPQQQQHSGHPHVPPHTVLRLHPRLPALTGTDFECVPADGEVSLDPMAGMPRSRHSRPIGKSAAEPAPAEAASASAIGGRGAGGSASATVAATAATGDAGAAVPGADHDGAETSSTVSSRSGEGSDDDEGGNDSDPGVVEDGGAVRCSRGQEQDGEGATSSGTAAASGDAGATSPRSRSISLAGVRSRSISFGGLLSRPAPATESATPRPSPTSPAQASSSSSSSTPTASLSYTSLMSEAATGGGSASNAAESHVLVDSLPERGSNRRSAAQSSSSSSSRAAGVGGSDYGSSRYGDRRDEGGRDSRERRGGRSRQGADGAQGATYGPQDEFESGSEVDLRVDADRPFGRTRDARAAAEAATRCRFVVSCSEAQDAVALASDGTLKVSIAVRMREYAAVGGEGEYLYVDLQGRPHGYPTAGSSGRATAQTGAPGAPFLRRQEGVLRTNCIDCLDRTNVAQVCVGVHLLGLQLYSLGLSDSEALDPSDPLVRHIMELYEAHGDAIAMQYGGSEANKKVTSTAHEDSVRTSGDGGEGSGGADGGGGKSGSGGGAGAGSGAGGAGGAISFFGSTASSAVAAVNISGTVSKMRLSSSGPAEILTSLQRYYSNSFTDSIKQASMNLFLGLWRPRSHAKAFHLWELESDHYLHNAALTCALEEAEARDAADETDDAIADLQTEGALTSSSTRTSLYGSEWWSAPLEAFRRTGLPHVVDHENAYAQAADGAGVTGQDKALVSRGRSYAVGGAALGESVSGSQDRLTSFDALLAQPFAAPQPGPINWTAPAAPRAAGRTNTGGVSDAPASGSAGSSGGAASAEAKGEGGEAQKEGSATAQPGSSNAVTPQSGGRPPLAPSAHGGGGSTTPSRARTSVLNNEAFSETLFADILSKAARADVVQRASQGAGILSARIIDRTVDGIAEVRGHADSLKDRLMETAESVKERMEKAAGGAATSLALASGREKEAGKKGAAGGSNSNNSNNSGGSTPRMWDVGGVGDAMGKAFVSAGAVASAMRDSVIGGSTGGVAESVAAAYAAGDALKPKEDHGPGAIGLASGSHANVTVFSGASTSALDSSFLSAPGAGSDDEDEENGYVSHDDDDDVEGDTHASTAAGTMGQDTAVAAPFSPAGKSPLSPRGVRRTLRTGGKRVGQAMDASVPSLASPTQYAPLPDPYLSPAFEARMSDLPPSDQALYERYAALAGAHRHRSHGADIGGSSSTTAHQSPAPPHTRGSQSGPGSAPAHSSSSASAGTHAPTASAPAPSSSTSSSSSSSSSSGRVHVVTSKSDIDLFRSSVLIGSGQAQIQAALQSGVGTAAELAAFEAAGAGGAAAGSTGNRGNAGALAAAAAAAAAGLHPLSMPQLADTLQSGPFRGLPRTRLAAGEIRAHLAHGENYRCALYSAYVSGNLLSTSLSPSSPAWAAARLGDLSHIPPSMGHDEPAPSIPPACEGILLLPGKATA
jgi:hypothetical protein